jgi:hypothetical protein
MAPEDSPFFHFSRDEESLMPTTMTCRAAKRSPTFLRAAVSQAFR